MSYVLPGGIYTNVLPVAMHYEPHVPVPGWGMHPVQAGPRRIAIGGYGASGLGWTGDATLVIPGLGTKTAHINVPLEKMAEDVATATLAKIWPIVEDKITKELAPQLLAEAQKQIVSKLWPVMQPKLRAEVDRVATPAKQGAVVAVVAIMGAIGLGAWWISKKKG
jgi:hypothetical protein